MKVPVTDYAWKDLDMECAILGNAGATLVVARQGTEDELEGLAADVSGIFTNWKPVTERTIRPRRGARPSAVTAWESTTSTSLTRPRPALS